MFDFSRRINGSTYYAGVALAFSIGIGAALIGELPHLGAVVDTIIGLTIILVALVLFIYFLCLIRQRANDIGWHPLIITGFGFWTPIFFILGLIPGQKRANKFGSAPRRGVTLKP